MTDTQFRTWTLHIPAPDEFINANHRHNRQQIAGRVRNWRAAGAIYARQAKLPKLQVARVQAELHFTDRRDRDDHNYYPTIKAIIDGIVGDYGALPNDNRKHLRGCEICPGEPVEKKPYGPCGAVTIHLIEVPE